ncbi:MAG TPA: PaaI family thioesterase [Desulfomonilaceae bacterium]|nr:PaaI family thioesterase [Desulfomonilaceae bacterium]
MADTIPLQDRLNPDAEIRHCYGCGADNAKGLQLKSFFDGEEGISTWHAQEHHCSYPGFLNGGIATTLIDCHSAWTAFAAECRDRGIDMERGADLPTGWTRAIKVEFLKPARLDAEVTLRAKVTKKGRTSRTIACSVYSDGDECIRGEVIMVMIAGSDAVKDG